MVHNDGKLLLVVIIVTMIALRGTTCLTPLVQYGLACFMRSSSCQGSPSFATLLGTFEEHLR